MLGFLKKNYEYEKDFWRIPYGFRNCWTLYTAVVFSSTAGSERDIKSLIIYGVLGVVFFVSGIELIITTKDES